MKKIILYFVGLVFATLATTGCSDDEKSFSVKPLIGFETVSGTLVQTNTAPLRVGFHTNVKLTEPVTVKVQVVNVSGLQYGTDYTIEPAPEAGVITVTIDPEDERPSFFVFPVSTGAIEGNLNFQLFDVQGAQLGLAQATALEYKLSIRETEILAPGTVTLASIRARFTGSTVTISEDIFVEGIVIASNDNVTARSTYVQDASAGICLRFVDPNTLLRGNKVRISLLGSSVSAFNGLLQLNLANNKAQVLGTEVLPTPTQITVAQLNTLAYESRLVRVVGVTFPQANETRTLFGENGNTNFTDDTGTGVMRVESYAVTSIRDMILPSGTHTLTGVASTFTTAQLIPMAASDIQ